MWPTVPRRILRHKRDRQTPLRATMARGQTRGKKGNPMPQKAKRLGYFHVMAYSLTGGRAYRGDAYSPAGFLKLTTTGRKSGQSRTVHLLYIREGPAYVVTASNSAMPRNPGWFFN